MKLLRRHAPDVFSVDIIQFLGVKNGRGFGDIVNRKAFDHLLQGHDFPFAARTPAQKRDIVEDGLFKIAFGNQVLIRGVSVPLGELVRLVFHHRRAVDIEGNLPAEGLVEQVVFGRRGQVFSTPDHMGDAHQMVVHHVGEVVGGHAVGLDQHLIVQGGVFHRDIAENLVVEGGAAAVGDALPDYIGYAGGKLLRDFRSESFRQCLSYAAPGPRLFAVPAIPPALFFTEAAVGGARSIRIWA
jgi:hypothetical protein